MYPIWICTILFIAQVHINIIMQYKTKSFLNYHTNIQSPYSTTKNMMFFTKKTPKSKK